MNILVCYQGKPEYCDHPDYYKERRNYRDSCDRCSSCDSRLEIYFYESIDDDVIIDIANEISRFIFREPDEHYYNVLYLDVDNYKPENDTGQYLFFGENSIFVKGEYTYVDFDSQNWVNLQNTLSKLVAENLGELSQQAQETEKLRKQKEVEESEKQSRKETYLRLKKEFENTNN